MIVRKTAILISTLAAALSFATAAVQADPSASKRETETSGVTPNKADSSAGEAKRDGTGDGRATPAEQAPTKDNSPKN